MDLPDWWSSDEPYAIADCLEGMKQLPDGVIHCVVTSPPYWGLRDYGTAHWEGGDPECDHIEKLSPQHLSKFTDKADPRKNPRNPNRQDDDQINFMKYKNVCKKCGAKRVDEQLGLETTPDDYVNKIVEIFREIKRILRDDGTVWLNLGDSYVGSGKAGTDPEYQKRHTQFGQIERKERLGVPIGAKKIGLKPKDLIGIPWRIAFALQSDGWYLRSDIIEEVELFCPCGCGHVLEERIWRYSQDREMIWKKTNPMPESVMDRPTKSHEYIFLLSKSQKYYYDMDAIREKGVMAAGTKGAKGSKERFRIDGVNSRPSEYKVYDGMRNKRSVWEIQTMPYSDAHFATYPPDLIKPCILAGTSHKGCCSKCGAPWKRIVEKIGGRDWHEDKIKSKGIIGEVSGNGGNKRGQSSASLNDVKKRNTIGWKPTCSCDAEILPCIVFDPFLGSGTTIEVSRLYNRIGLGFELNPDYESLIRKRIKAGANLDRWF